MSGLCGWFSHEPAPVTLGQMAAPLWQFDQAPLRTAAHGAGAVALAAGLDSARLVQEDGLIIAMWGERVDGLARLWRSHGPKACAALSGSFACVVLDERKDEAFLAMDRCASRALMYRLVGRTLVFASSAAAMVRHPGVGRDLDPQTLFDYLFFHAVPGPASVYAGMRRLQAGEYLHLRAGRLERGRYWSPKFHERQTLTPGALQEEFGGTLRTAVENCMGQQPAAALLGEGGQGASVAAMLGTLGGSPARTYAVGYDAPGRSAMAQSRELARFLGSRHGDYLVTAADAADAVPALAAGFDQPFGNPDALGLFYAARMARADGVARLLGSDGDAELFGARERYAHQARLSHYEALPSALRQLLVEPLLFQLARGIDGAPLRRMRGYVEHALVALPARLEAANLLNGYGCASVLDPGFLDSVDPTAALDGMAQCYGQTFGASEINQLIALDMQYVLAGQALPAAMKGCELAGVEARFPFLDDAMVAFAARLAPRHKHGGARGFLGMAMREALPRSLRGLHGGAAHDLAAPIGYWLQTDRRLRALAFDSLSDLKARRIVRAGFIDALLIERMPEQPAYHGNMVWVLMMLEQWFVQHQPAWPSWRATSRSGHAASASR